MSGKTHQLVNGASYENEHLGHNQSKAPTGTIRRKPQIRATALVWLGGLGISPRACFMNAVLPCMCCPQGWEPVCLWLDAAKWQQRRRRKPMWPLAAGMCCMYSGQQVPFSIPELICTGTGWWACKSSDLMRNTLSNFCLIPWNRQRSTYSVIAYVLQRVSLFPGLVAAPSLCGWICRWRGHTSRPPRSPVP